MLPISSSLQRSSTIANPDALRQLPHRRRKIDVLVIHDESKNAPAHAAAEAVKRLPLRLDRERWRLFLMKRTERLEIRAGALQRKIRSDHFHDVIRARDLLDCLGRDRHFFFVLGSGRGKLSRERPLPILKQSCSSWRCQIHSLAGESLVSDLSVVQRPASRICSRQTNRRDRRTANSFTKATSSSFRCRARSRRRFSFSATRNQDGGNRARPARSFSK